MHVMQYRIAHDAHTAASCTLGVSRYGCVVLHVQCTCIITYCRLWMQHINVLPVLKHGPRSLMCVQVRDRDHPMHNKRNYVHVVICCRQICLNAFEHEHAH